MNTVRITFTIPREDYKFIEQLRNKNGMKRSRVIQKMIEFYIQKKNENEKIAKYVAGYQRKPENIRNSKAYENEQAKVIGDF